jgi:hypothetical protein
LKKNWRGGVGWMEVTFTDTGKEKTIYYWTLKEHYFENIF